MTDAELVAKKLATILTCVEQLRTLARPELLGQDIREERFVEHTLQIAIQAALDVAAHIVSDERLGEPQTNQELFVLLRQRLTLSDELLRDLRRMAGFRNVLVHGYDTVNLDVVRSILATKLEDLVEFARLVRVHMHL